MIKTNIRSKNILLLLMSKQLQFSIKQDPHWFFHWVRLSCPDGFLVPGGHGGRHGIRMVTQSPLLIRPLLERYDCSNGIQNQEVMI